MRCIRVVAFAAVVVLGLAAPRSIRASELTFPALTDPGSVTLTGTFVQDNDLAEVLFTLTGDSTFYASTSDGTNGLDSLLTLLSVGADGTRNRITDNDDSPLGGTTDSLLVDALTNQPGIFLAAGTYELVVSQTFNYFNDQTGGFTFDDSPAYTCDPAVFGIDNPLCTGFMPFGVQTGASFSLTFGTTPPGKDVPEPATLALLGTGLAGMIGRARRRVR